MHLYLTRVTPLMQLKPMTMLNADKASAFLKFAIHGFMILPMNQCLYWYFNGFFNHNLSHSGGKRVFEEKVVHGNALWLSLLFWLPVSAALYTRVPLHLGNLAIDGAGLGWAVILSYLGARNEGPATAFVRPPAPVTKSTGKKKKQRPWWVDPDDEPEWVQRRDDANEALLAAKAAEGRYL